MKSNFFSVLINTSWKATAGPNQVISTYAFQVGAGCFRFLSCLLHLYKIWHYIGCSLFWHFEIPVYFLIFHRKFSAVLSVSVPTSAWTALCIEERQGWSTDLAQNFGVEYSQRLPFSGAVLHLYVFVFQMGKLVIYVEILFHVEGNSSWVGLFHSTC